MCGEFFGIRDNNSQESAALINRATSSHSNQGAISISCRLWGFLAFGSSLTLLLVGAIMTAKASTGEGMLIAGAVLSACFGALFFGGCCNSTYLNIRREKNADYKCYQL